MKATKIYSQQNKIIHKGFATLGMPYHDNKDQWISLFADISRRRVTGLSDLTLKERYRVIRHLKQQRVNLNNPGVPPVMAGWKKGDQDIVSSAPVGKRYPGKPDYKQLAGTGKLAMIKKIEAYLAEAGRPWKYAHNIAKRMFKIDLVQWCNSKQLHSIIVALEKDAIKNGRYTGR